MLQEASRKARQEEPSMDAVPAEIPDEGGEEEDPVDDDEEL